MHAVVMVFVLALVGPPTIDLYEHDTLSTPAPSEVAPLGGDEAVVDASIPEILKADVRAPDEGTEVVNPCAIETSGPELTPVPLQNVTANLDEESQTGLPDEPRNRIEVAVLRCIPLRLSKAPTIGCGEAPMPHLEQGQALHGRGALAEQTFCGSGDVEHVLGDANRFAGLRQR